ncbi:hypothetical protein NMG60_11005148 [Bertholletia excelsa]
MDQWVMSALERNVNEVDLCFHFQFNGTDRPLGYTLPQPLLNARSLAVLSLFRCSLHETDVAVPRLRKLYMKEVLLVHQETLKSLLLSCSSSIEDLKLSFCKELRSLKLGPNMSQLKFVKIKNCHDLSSLFIGLPSLDTLLLEEATSGQVQLNYLEALKVLKLNRHTIDETLLQAISGAPNLEILECDRFEFTTKLKISSPRLKRLINASKRDYFDYFFGLHWSTPFIYIESPQLLRFDLKMYLDDYESNWICLLIDSLAKCCNDMDLKFVLYCSRDVIIHESFCDVFYLFKLRLHRNEAIITSKGFAELLDDVLMKKPR